MINVQEVHKLLEALGVILDLLCSEGNGLRAKVNENKLIRVKRMQSPQSWGADGAGPAPEFLGLWWEAAPHGWPPLSLAESFFPFLISLYSLLWCSVSLSFYINFFLVSLSQPLSLSIFLFLSIS